MGVNHCQESCRLWGGSGQDLGQSSQSKRAMVSAAANQKETWLVLKCYWTVRKAKRWEVMKVGLCARACVCMCVSLCVTLCVNDECVEVFQCPSP